MVAVKMVLLGLFRKQALNQMEIAMTDIRIDMAKVTTVPGTEITGSPEKREQVILHTQMKMGIRDAGFPPDITEKLLKVAKTFAPNP